MDMEIDPFQENIRNDKFEPLVNGFLGHLKNFEIIQVIFRTI